MPSTWAPLQYANRGRMTDRQAVGGNWPHETFPLECAGHHGIQGDFHMIVSRSPNAFAGASRAAAVALLGLATLLSATAEADGRYGGRYDGVYVTRGTVYSVGRADPRGQSGQPMLQNGVLVDANYSSVFLNGGIGAKNFDGHNVVNLYAGFGFSRILQIQAGYGDRGPLGRIRTDLNLREVFNFVTSSRQHPRERTLADRVTFTYTVERYSDANNGEFDNGTIGIGVLFDGPF